MDLLINYSLKVRSLVKFIPTSLFVSRELKTVIMY